MIMKNEKQKNKKVKEIYKKIIIIREEKITENKN